MYRTSAVGLAALLMVVAAATAARAVSTNPDVPTPLKVNTIIGQMLQGDGKSFDNYYSLQAGPGTVKVRVTLRAGSDAGDLEVGLTDSDGTKLSPASCTGSGICNGDNVVASGQGDQLTTGIFQLDAKKSLVMHVHGSAQYYHEGPRPTYRITLDGDVSLDKTAKPMQVINR